MKIWIREGDSSVNGALTAPIGPSSGKNVLFTFDVWYGSEWDFQRTQLAMHKEAPISFRGDGGFAVGMRANFRLAKQFEHNQPPGGPYVLFAFAHAEANAWLLSRGTTFGQNRFPTNAPADQQRDYGNEDLGPAEAEFGVVPERWTRYWHYFERAPDRDWVSDWQSERFNGKQMAAYRWSLWAADTERGPVQLMNGDRVVVGMLAGEPQQITEARFTMSAGNAGRDTEGLAGRGDLVSYQRNWVALHGTSRREVLALLKKPVGD